MLPVIVVVTSLTAQRPPTLCERYWYFTNQLACAWKPFGPLRPSCSKISLRSAPSTS